MPNQDRGFMIAETVAAINFEYHLKMLAKQRERRKKEKAYTEGAVQTSSEVKNTFFNYTTDEEECQDVKSDTPGDITGGEVWQQGPGRELPVHLL